MTKLKPNLPDQIEAQLRECGQWPQPGWILAEIARELDSDIASLVRRRVTSDYVRKLYRRPLSPTSPA